MSQSIKLPKRIAGVKIPKPLRRAAEAALAEVASPTGRELLAAALAAAAAALRDGREDGDDERAESPTPAPPRPPVDLASLMGLATTVIGGLRAAGERRADAARPDEG